MIMNEFLRSIQDAFIARLNNSFFINFIIAWCIVNYETVLLMFFDSMPIGQKIVYLHYFHFDLLHALIYPLLLAFSYIFILPLLNLGISILYHRYINISVVQHKNKLLKDHYSRIKDIEEVKLKSTTFVEKEIENNMSKEALATENEKLATLQSINEENKKNIENKEKELQINKKNMEILQEKNNIEELMHKMTMLENYMTSDTRSIEIEYIMKFTDKGISLLPEIRDHLINPSVYIVMPKDALTLPVPISNLEYKNKKHLSFQDISNLVGTLLVPVDMIDHRFSVVRYRFSDDEEKLFKSFLENKGYTELHDEIDEIDTSKLTGKEIKFIPFDEVESLKKWKVS